MNYALKIQRAFRRFIKERYKIEAECKEFGTKYYTLKNKEVVYLFKKKIDI